jgi:hypothetical protein
VKPAVVYVVICFVAALAVLALVIWMDAGNL